MRDQADPSATVGETATAIVTAGETARERPWHQVLVSLRVRDFRRWFLSQLVSTSGTMTQSVAQAWLVLRLSGRAIDLGALSAVTMLPVLLGSPIAGALLGRFEKRRLLVLTQSAFLVLAALLGVLTTTGAVRIWMVFAVAAAFGIVMAADGPARQVYVLDLVGTSRTANAISLNEVVLNVSRVLGPAVGGVLLATLGVATCFYVNAATYVLPILVLVSQRHLTSAAAPRASSIPGALGDLPATVQRAAEPSEGEIPGRRRPASLREGFGYAWHNRVIRYGLIMAAASGMIFNLGVALPLVATRTFHVGGGGYSAMVVAFGCGAIVGALLAAGGASHPDGRRVRLLAALTGLAVLGAASMPDYVAELGALCVLGLLSIWFIALANTVVQLRAVPEMRGAMMGLWVMVLPGAGVLTGPLTGWVSGAAGAREGLGLAGVILLGAAVLGWRAYDEHVLAPREMLPTAGP